MTGIFQHNPAVDILAMETGWLVADKPSGMSVHNDPGHDLCSQLDAIVQKDPAMCRRLGYDSDFGFHPVHRLDRQTSGVILFACTPDIFRYFSHQFENRTVKKQYIALLHGNLRETTESIWTYPLGLKSGGRSNPKGSGSKQAASTRYRVLEYSRHYTLTECEPLTGRKHQIRRHAKLSGHPVVGDARYGSVRAVKFLKTNHGFDRQALHAVSLSIQPPHSSEKITLRTVQIPDAIQTLFQNDQPEKNT